MIKLTGFSLFEMLLACVLGSVIMVGMLSCYANIKKHFSEEFALLEIQDAANMASHFLSSDIRQAGFMGAFMDAKFINHRYFVDNTTRRQHGKTVKALYRRGDDGKKQELIEDIDEMRVYYFVDGRFVKADAVSDWLRVTGVSIHLLLEAPGIRSPFYQSYFFDGKMRVSSDKIFRQEREVLVAFRNRLS